MKNYLQGVMGETSLISIIFYHCYSYFILCAFSSWRYYINQTAAIEWSERIYENFD